MLVAICGPSGAGKSSLEEELRRQGAKRVVNYTTRDRRPGERNTVDYNFISKQDYEDMLKENLFCISEKYSGDRYYGTLKEDIVKLSESKDIYAITLTPNGIRAVDALIEDKNNLIKVMVTASLGVRVKRYIDRKGDMEFNFDDMNEINARVNRDFGMFLNMEDSMDMVLDNTPDHRYGYTGMFSITNLANQVLLEAQQRINHIERADVLER